ALRIRVAACAAVGREEPVNVIPGIEIELAFGDRRSFGDDGAGDRVELLVERSPGRIRRGNVVDSREAQDVTEDELIAERPLDERMVRNGLIRVANAHGASWRLTAHSSRPRRAIARAGRMGDNEGHGRRTPHAPRTS